MNALIAQTRQFLSEGKSLYEACALVGISQSCMTRWLNPPPPKARKKIGRPQIFSPSEDETRIARWWRLNKESLSVAAHFFVQDERICEETREVIRTVKDKALRTGKAEHWPDSIRRAFRVTETDLALFRGSKAAQNVEMVIRRGMYEVLGGVEVPILSGNTWELDDYSANQPYVFPDPITGEQMLGRQVLACRDLASAKWLAFDMIGRERDAYRGEDIVRYIGRLVRSYGLPHRLRLERGSWESSYVHGIEVEGMTKRWGDLAEIIIIEHVFKSRGKAIIEGGFNVLQRFLSQCGPDIGRYRGEFEEATRLFLKAKSTKANPLDLGFLTQDRSLLAHIQAAEEINSRPMLRAHLAERVSPNDLVRREGWNTSPFTEDFAWYFLPYKTLRTVRAGFVEVNPGNGWKRLQFAINGIRENIYCENGHQVLVAYDPARPDLGARICNGDRSAKNREGWSMGELLIDAAPALGRAPQFADENYLSPHLKVAKKAKAAAVTSYKAVRSAGGLPQPISTRESVAMDGNGNLAMSGDIPRQESATREIEKSPVSQYRPTREIQPATSSRAMPADPAAEIRRLQAALIAD